MDASLQVVLSGALTFGVPILIGVRELLLLKPGRGGWSGEHVPEPVAGPPSPSADAPPRPLPACLIPNLPAVRPARTLEPV